ncbi:MAG: TolC family protein [Planctomycetota bacterium]
MEVSTRRGLRLLILCSVLGACVQYEPLPLDPSTTEAAFQARSLSDPGLTAYARSVLGEGAAFPPKRWNLLDLTLAAFFYHGDLAVARSQARTAQARILTASARPNPDLGLDLEFGGNSPAGTSPWIAGFQLGIPIQTAGKRGLQTEVARHEARAAELAVYEKAWEVRARLRGSLLDLFFLRAQRDLEKRETEVRDVLSSLLESRLRAGAASTPEADAARLEARKASLRLLELEGRLRTARARVASSLGVPLPSLEGAAFTFPALENPPPEPSLPGLRVEGLVNRMDVRRMLEEYAAAEASLGLEIARQYPDFRLGPGFLWDQGVGKVQLLPAATLPFFNRNEGPIAVAKARRDEVGARFESLQARVLAAMETAFQQYHDARQAFAQSEALLELCRKKLAAIRQRLEIGEVDRLVALQARLECILLERERWNRIRQAQEALGALETALQRPMDSSQDLPLPPSPPANTDRS